MLKGVKWFNGAVKGCKNFTAAVSVVWDLNRIRTKKMVWSDSLIVRNYIINKNISLEYHLRKAIGKKMARWICLLIEKIFTTLFGREVYQEEG